MARRSRLILASTAVSALLALIVTLMMPTLYTATARILPPQPAQSFSSAVMSQLTPIAGLVGSRDLMRNPSDLYVSMLQSRTVADALVERFSLTREYRDKYKQQARDDLAKHSDISTGKEGVITIVVDDKDPVRAANLANGYIDELYKLSQGLAITEASQRRLFFQNELLNEKNELANAEVQLKIVQERTGLIEPAGQARAIIESVARIKSQISAKEVALHALQTFATSQNPDLQRLQSEISTLRSQLAEMEKGERMGEGEIQIPTGKIPKAGLEYFSKLRDVKYAETLYEILARQLEIAKIDESKSATIIQVLDKALPPEKSEKPHRAIIVIVAALSGFFVGMILAILADALHLSKEDPKNRAKLNDIRSVF